MRSPAVQTPRDLDDLPLAIAVDQQIGLGIEQNRAAHLLRPVVEMRDAAQRCLDAADHDRHVAVGLARALRVDDHRAIGPLAALAAGRVGIVAAHAPVGGVAIDHRIHVAGGDAEEQSRRTQRAQAPRALCQSGCAIRPTRSPCASSTRPIDRHAEARMIHIGIAGHDDDVALLPAKRLHFRARHRQKRRRRGRALRSALRSDRKRKSGAASMAPHYSRWCQ